MMPQATNLTQLLWPAEVAVESGDASSWILQQVNESVPQDKFYPSFSKASMLPRTDLPSFESGELDKHKLLEVVTLLRFAAAVLKKTM